MQYPGRKTFYHFTGIAEQNPAGAVMIKQMSDRPLFGRLESGRLLEFGQHIFRQIEL